MLDDHRKLDVPAPVSSVDEEDDRALAIDIVKIVSLLCNPRMVLAGAMMNRISSKPILQFAAEVVDVVGIMLP